MNNDKLILEGMKEWVDFDLALFGIGRALGVFPKEYQDIPDIKALLWSKNQINDCLTKIADELVSVGYLEYDGVRLRYRLKEGFNATEEASRTNAAG